MPNIYRIHPAIGIARVGDSANEYFVGPEAPGFPPSLNRPDAPHDPNAGYKDDQGRIKRQGARFRIYEYTFDDAGGLIQVREITDDDAQIEWEVHLANRKAAAPRFKAFSRRNEGEDESTLIIDAGPQKIRGAGQDMKRLQGRFMNVDVPIGDLLTDGAGRLIILGGFGKSRSPSGRGLEHFANNDGWCDDVSDGPVRATIQLNGGAETVEAEPARVIVAPPDFAPPIENVITLYDVVYNTATKLHPVLAAQARWQGNKRIFYDRLVGIVGFFSNRSAGTRNDYQTLVEATENGWWYSAGLPDSRVVVAYMTDADLLPKGSMPVSEYWQDRLERAPNTRPRLSGCVPETGLRSVAANSYRMDPVTGNNWLVAGDAAIAFDPLSSQGIYRALKSGLLAAQAFENSLLGDQTALKEYARGVQRSFDTYLSMRAITYGRERRWTSSAFWQRRHNESDHAQ